MAEPDSLLQAKIKELDFMVGQWAGEGWMQRGPEKSVFKQTENIQFKLDSTAILIEGKGQHDGKVIHNAMAIITYDKAKGHYNFRSYLPNGMSGDFKAELIENKLYWYPNPNVRYVIWKNAQKQWYEKGEYKGGDNWMQFFEMTLNKSD